LLSTGGAVLYKALNRFTGLSFRSEGGHAVLVMNLLLAGAPHLILLAYAYRFLRWLAPGSRTLLWTFACFAFGNLGLAYATSINNHTPAAASVLVAFFYAFGVRHGLLERQRHWVFAGLLAGLAPTLDLGTLFVSSAVGIYLLSHDWRMTLRWFVPAALLPLIAHFGLTWLITGAVAPIYLRPELYHYPGSYWNAPTGIDALDEPRATYLFNVLLGHHGLFSMTPVLALASWALLRTLVSRGRYWAEAAVVGAPTCILIVFYTLTTKNYGGHCAGFRWLLPVTPLLLLFVPSWLDQVRRRWSVALFVLCVSIGQYHAFDALRGPWAVSSWDRWLGS
jgi:hypothetical protein